MDDPAKSRSRRKPGVTLRARQLRQDGTDAEAALWSEIKTKRLGGFKFVRQLPIGPYFADFACRSHRLVVEVDGSQHAGSVYDAARDEFMRLRGYSVLRFWNHDALRAGAEVCATILAALEGRLAEDVEAYDMKFVFARGVLPLPR